MTENRLKQAVTEACQGEYNPKYMGAFLQWIAADIIKESVAELEASNLTWKEVNKPINNAAKTWFMNKAQS